MALSRSWAAAICALCALAVNVKGHTYISYPGWRGNNLGITDEYPFGMQRGYPCGGLPPSSNRTHWPITGGGGIAIQPGWYTGHSTALICLNIGLGTSGPGGEASWGTYPNTSWPLQPPFQIDGPSNNPYPGMFCLPQVPLSLPEGVTVNVGDLATIQVVETTLEGSALYNCVDIIFSLPSAVAPLNATNCFNTTDISFGPVTTTTPSSSQTTAQDLFGFASSTCTPCPSPTSSACPSQTACPKSNVGIGDSGTRDCLGAGVGALGVLVLRVLAL